MSFSHPSDEGGRHKPEEHQQRTHRPEFIVIEDTNHEFRSQTSHSKEEKGYGSFEELSSVRFPFSIRIMSIGLSALMFMSAIAALVGCIFAALFVLLTLGWYEPSKDFLKKSYGWWKKSIVLSLGFFVAIFSPPFGFAIIIIYFLMLGEKINHDILGKMLNSATR